MAIRVPTPLTKISVPQPAADEVYQRDLFGRTFSFHGLKRLLGAADHSKAGDRHAGLAAADELEREAARSILSSLTLRHLYLHPLTDERGAVNAVMRVNYDIDREVFESLADRTLGELKDHLLRSPPAQIRTLALA